MPHIPGNIAERLAAWGTFSVIRPLSGGHRNASVLVEDAQGERFVAKTTRRCEAAVAWAADIQVAAEKQGLGVARYIARDGLFVRGSLTLEPFVDGQAGAQADVARLIPAMARLHQATRSCAQRPGFASATELMGRDRGGDINLSAMPLRIAAACRAAWAPLAGCTEAAIHADLSSANIVVGAGGNPVLLDWDEARRDTPMFDRTEDPGIALAHLAWEVASGWTVEPAHARRLAARLLAALSSEASRP